MTRVAPGGSTGLPGPHGGCRISEFSRWDRTMLEHERSHISRCMAGKAFKSKDEIDALMHDLTDLDYVLSCFPPRIEVPQ